VTIACSLSNALNTSSFERFTASFASTGVKYLSGFSCPSGRELKKFFGSAQKLDESFELIFKLRFVMTEICMTNLARYVVATTLQDSQRVYLLIIQ